MTNSELQQNFRRWLIVMLTVQECKKILEKDGTKYSDEEAEILRDVLYKIAEIDIQQINNN